MNKQFKRYLQISLILLDLIILNIAFFIPKLLFGGRIVDNYFSAYLSFWLFMNSIWLILCFVSGTYVEKIIIHFETFTKRTLQVYILWMIALLFYLFFSREIQVSRFFILTFIVSFAVGLFINRFLYVGIKSYFKSHDDLFNKVIILRLQRYSLETCFVF
jgi:putative colanic acid biosynthesis UDP-glucose lipid carrier transferase